MRPALPITFLLVAVLFTRNVAAETVQLSVIASSGLDGALAPAACRGPALADGPSAAHLAAAVLRARAEASADGRRVVGAVHLGDLTGPAAIGRFLMAQPDGPARYAGLAARLGFGQIVAGNDLFALGPKALAALLGELGTRGVPLLSSNLQCEGREDCAALAAQPARAWVELGGIRVAIIAATSASVFAALDPTDRAGLTLEPLAAALAQAAQRARAEGADLVIAATHLTGDAPGLGLVASSLRDLSGVDLLLVNHLGDTPGSAATLQPREGPAVAVTGTTPTSVVRFDVDLERVGGRLAIAHLEAHRVEALSPEPALAEDLEALRRAFCDTLSRPLGATTHGALTPGEFTAFALDALRERSEAEVALVNDGIVRREVFPLDGDLSASDVYSALPYDDVAVKAHITGSRLRAMWKGQPVRPNGTRRIAWAGLEDRDGTVLVNGRPLDDGQPYAVVLPDFVARGGDGLIGEGLVFEVLRDEQGNPRQVRDAVLDALAAPGATEVLAGQRSLDLSRRFRFSWSAGATFGANDTRFPVTPTTSDPRFQKSASSALRGEGTGRIDADQRDHALRFSGRAKYARTSVGASPFDETEDLLYLEALYRLPALRRVLDGAAYAPIPYVSSQFDTEFVQNPGAGFRHGELGATLGVRFLPLRPLELKVGFGVRREVFDPAGRSRLGFELGYELPRFSPLRVGGLPLDLESNLDYFVSDLAGATKQEARLRARLTLPLGGVLSLAAGVDLLALQPQGAGFSVLSDTTIGLSARFDGARQAF